ncbi:MAG: hypothetical protein IPM55_19275 [Acidobacteria bacterium]|nr:hypothetical protein [Acidobacteriota bacterium]
MGLPEIFSTSQANSFEQSLMMATFEVTSWLLAFIAVMTVLVTVAGIVRLIRSESSRSRAEAARVRRGHVPLRQPPTRKARIPALHLSGRTTLGR